MKKGDKTICIKWDLKISNRDMTIIQIRENLVMTNNIFSLKNKYGRKFDSFVDFMMCQKQVLIIVSFSHVIYNMGKGDQIYHS